MCMVCVYVHMCIMLNVWRSEVIFVASLLSFHFHMGSQDWTQVTRACTASAFTHGAVSPALYCYYFIVNVVENVSS